jgi:hypothetical protein
MTGKVYIHELIHIVGHNRARYQHHMTANWVPIGIEERNQLCYGVWSMVGSTGPWPQAVNMWELDGWDGLVRNFEVEFGSGHGHQDPSLSEWWSTAASMRRGGLDRIVVPDAASRSIEQLCADGVRGEPYCHELVMVAPGQAASVLAAVREDAEPAYASEGLVLVGAFRTALRADDELLLLWAAPDWKAWGDFEQAWLADDGPVARWRTTLLARGARWQRNLLVDAELSPMRLGRQPDEDDRRPLDGF